MNPVLALPAAGVSVVVGLLVLRARQGRIGALLVAHGLCFGVLLVTSAQSAGGPGLVVDQLAAGSWVFLFFWLVLIAYLLPDGHPASTFWRRWVQVGVLGVAAFMVGAAGDADAFRDAHDGIDPPLRWLPAVVSDALGVLGLILTILLFGGCVVAVRARLVRASGVVRLQLLWLVWGAISLPAALVLAWVGHFLANDNTVVVDAAVLLAGVGLPIAIGVAVLRFRLFDIQVVLSRTLTYGVLVVAVVVLYALLLLGADRLLGDSTVGGLVAVGIVAVAVHPAYAFLRKRIERWVYGYRSDPAVALRRLGASVESADPLDVVDTISASVADALKVDHVWVEAPGTTPSEVARVTRVPLVQRGQRIGALAVEVPPGRTLSAADLALLHDLAGQVAVTVRAAELAAELQSSRLRIVTAREEERRRLRRDLHDGVGPSLAAILLKLHAARSRTDDAERDALLAEIGDETKAAIVEVRRAVDDLRPPAIDEVGLMGAIRQRAAALSTDQLTIRVSGPDRLPPLPAAVEVAAFRIVSEAMTNAVRHSHARRCNVELELAETLRVTVSDDGSGTAAASSGNGVGWTSMVQRAAELDGSCTISGRDGGGVVVSAVLPVPETADTDADLDTDVRSLR